MKLRLRIIEVENTKLGESYCVISKTVDDTNKNKAHFRPAVLEYLDEESNSWIPVEVLNEVVPVKSVDLGEVSEEVSTSIPGENPINPRGSGGKRHR